MLAKSRKSILFCVALWSGILEPLKYTKQHETKLLFGFEADFSVCYATL